MPRWSEAGRWVKVQEQILGLRWLHLLLAVAMVGVLLASFWTTRAFAAALLFPVSLGLGWLGAVRLGVPWHRQQVRDWAEGKGNAFQSWWVIGLVLFAGRLVLRAVGELWGQEVEDFLLPNTVALAAAWMATAWLKLPEVEREVGEEPAPSDAGGRSGRGSRGRKRR